MSTTDKEYISEKEKQDYISARDCRRSGLGKCNTCDIQLVCHTLNKSIYPKCLGHIGYPDASVIGYPDASVIGYPDASAGLDCMVCDNKCMCDSLKSCLTEPENDISKCYGNIEICDISNCEGTCEFFNACISKRFNEESETMLVNTIKKEDQSMSSLNVKEYEVYKSEPVNKVTKFTRKDILERAEHMVCGHREQDYGSPEDNFKRIGALWDAYDGGIPRNSPKDVAIKMALMKCARAAGDICTVDTLVDIAGYAACAGEIIAK